MGLSKLDICNHALYKIGDGGIISLDESSASSRLCTLFYQQALDEVLRDHVWKCASNRTVLAKLTTTPAFEYDYEFQLPADFIRIIEVFDENGNWNQFNTWTIEGDKLLTDLTGVGLYYVQSVTDPLILDPLATSALICKLASKMAYSRSKSQSMVESLANEYDRTILPKARSIDSLDNKPKLNTGYDSWILNRSGMLGGS